MYAIYYGSWGQVFTTLDLCAKDQATAEQEAQDRMPYGIRFFEEVHIKIETGPRCRPRWVDPSHKSL